MERDVLKEAAGIAGPPGSAIKALLTYSQLTAQEAMETRKAMEELLEIQRRRLMESKGVFSRVIRYRNDGTRTGAAGIDPVLSGDAPKEKIRAISLVTARVGGAGAEPETDSIYVKFGRGMSFEGVETLPSSFDLVLERGDQVNRFRTPQGVETIQLYALRSFDAVLFLTAGSPEALPEF